MLARCSGQADAEMTSSQCLSPVPEGSSRAKHNNEKERPRLWDGGQDLLPIDFYVNAGAPLSPNFHIWLSHTPTLFDCHIGLANPFPNCHVGATCAAFAT